ncbi:MAG TPA: hypothetical protein VGF30_06120, partial [Bacteroidia bacterium]
MKKLLVILLIISGYLNAQNLALNWLNTFGGPGNDGGEMVFDNSNNIIIAGEFYNTVDFDPSAGIQQETAYGQYDIFFSKFDRSGNFLFSKRIGGMSYDNIKGVQVDAENNIYIIGQFHVTIDLDPSSNVYNLNPIGSNNQFVAKYDSLGQFIYGKQFYGNNGEVKMNDFKIMDNELIVTGVFHGTIDMDPSASNYSLTAVSYDGFFAKYDLNGNLLFVKVFPGLPTTSMTPSYILIDYNKDILIIGNYADSVDFNPSVDTFYLPNCQVSGNCFFAKYDSLGNFIFAKNIKSEGGFIHATTLDSSGNIYLGGQMVGYSPIQFNSAD